jgi:acyl carrier protein
MAHVLSIDDAVVQIIAIDPGRVSATGTAGVRALLGGARNPAVTQTPATRSVVADLRAANAADQPDVLRAHVRQQVSAVLGLSAGAEPDDGQGLTELGMDSLMATELRTRLQRSLSLSLPATLAFEHPTIGALTTYLSDALGLHAPVPKPVAPPDALRDVADDEIARLLDEELNSAGF